MIKVTFIGHLIGYGEISVLSSFKKDETNSFSLGNQESIQFPYNGG